MDLVIQTKRLILRKWSQDVFDHPKLPKEHRLSRHVFYRIKWEKQHAKPK